jgi:hypothetical protein
MGARAASNRLFSAVSNQSTTWPGANRRRGSCDGHDRSPPPEVLRHFRHFRRISWYDLRVRRALPRGTRAFDLFQHAPGRRATGCRSTKEGHMMWVLIIGAAWLGVALAVALLLGRGILLADRQRTKKGVPLNVVVDEAPPTGATQPVDTWPLVPSTRTPAVRPSVLSPGRTPSTRNPGSA